MKNKGCRSCIFAKEYDTSTWMDDHQARIECNLNGKVLFDGSDKLGSWSRLSEKRPKDCPLSKLEMEEKEGKNKNLNRVAE